MVGEGVQGLRLHGRHDPRLRRLLADELRGRRLHRPADEHAGPAKGGGQSPGELAELSILSGPSKGGKATFSLDVTYLTGQAAPTGRLTFHDKAADRKVEATGIDSLTIAGAKASITGRATVDGVPGVSFFVEVEDVGKSADAFRIVLGDGYAAGGVLLKGNVEVTGGLVTP